MGGWKTCQKGNAKIMFDPTRFDLPGLFLVLPAEDSEEVGDALIRRIRLYECWIFMRRGANDDLNAYPSGDLIDDVQDAIDWGLQALNPDGTTGGRVNRLGLNQTLVWPGYPQGLVVRAYRKGRTRMNFGIPDPTTVGIILPIVTRNGTP